MHIRAVAGWPLGDTTISGPVLMTNLFGDEVLEAPKLAADPAVKVHVYGKRELIPGRKTGHATRLLKPRE
jgi:5-(carboxyamino)imidazole ribonucleotide synthase